ncbi:hypothetical protein [Leifsonia aquatica]|uniref:hypothetical protein n=1 Tax=Leifsonia aquatica TaxID=144185 RepID=UPI000469310A|nr:hypothetical protein [Leifsonia aquatica]
MNSKKATRPAAADIREDSDLDAHLATMRREYAAAKSTPCDFPGCDGSYHEPGVDPAEWAHHTGDVEFDSGEIVIDIVRNGSAAPLGQVWLAGNYEDLTPESLRALAAVYEGLPALMREQAERLEQIIREVVAR